MRRVRSKNTSVELAVRRMAHNMGYRFRLHRQDLPGRPDLVFPSRKKVIFVHGCFWDAHDCKRGNRMPRSNTNYWGPKLSRNKERDTEHLTQLTADGWGVLVVWECETRDACSLRFRLHDFLVQ